MAFGACHLKKPGTWRGRKVALMVMDMLTGMDGTLQTVQIKSRGLELGVSHGSSEEQVGRLREYQMCEVQVNR